MKKKKTIVDNGIVKFWKLSVGIGALSGFVPWQTIRANSFSGIVLGEIRWC
jgi:hypothetical protein